MNECDKTIPRISEEMLFHDDMEFRDIIGETDEHFQEIIDSFEEQAN